MTVRTILHLTEEPGTKVEILRTGKFFHAKYGEFEVSEKTLDQIIANFSEYGDEGRIPFDYNHASLEKDPDAAVAAGWILSIEKAKREDAKDPNAMSLMAEVEWTDRAQEFIKNAEYRFISPEFTFTYMDKETSEQKGARLLAAALTNRPFLPGMEPVALSEDEKTYLTVLQLGTTESLMERVNCVVRSFYARYSDNEALSYIIEDVRDSSVVARRMSRSSVDPGSGGETIYEIGYQMKGTSCEFDPPESWTKVKKAYVQATDPNQEGAMMDENKLRELLGLSAEDDIEESIAELVEAAQLADELSDEVAQIKEALAAQLSDEGNGNSVELTEAMTSLKGENVKLAEQSTAYKAEMIKLSERLASLEADRKTVSGKDRISNAIKARKLLPAEIELKDDKQPVMLKLATDQPEVFDEIIAARPEYDARMFMELSSAKDIVAEDKSEDKFWELVEQTSSANPALTQQQIRNKVLVDHPEYKPLFSASAAG